LPEFPAIGGQQLVSALERTGWVRVGQKGSHVTILSRDAGVAVTAPVHGSADLPSGTLRAILQQVSPSAEDLLGLL